MNDYLIHTGQQSSNHKYVARVKQGDKYRYFYTQAEAASYKTGKMSKSTSKMISEAAGTKNKKHSKSTNPISNTAKNVKNKVVGTKKNVKESLELRKTAKEFKKKGDEHKFWAKVSSTLANGERKDIAKDHKKDPNNSYQHNKQAHKYDKRARKEGHAAAQDYEVARNAQKRYEKTGIGKAEKAVKGTAKNAASSIKKGVNKASFAIRTAPNNMVSSAKDGISNLKKEAKNKAKSVKRSAENVKESVTGSKAKAISKELQNRGDTLKQLATKQTKNAKSVKKETDSSNVPYRWKHTGIALSKSLNESARKNGKAAASNYKMASYARQKYEKTPVGKVNKAVKKGTNRVKRAMAKIKFAASRH